MNYCEAERVAVRSLGAVPCLSVKEKVRDQVAALTLAILKNKELQNG